MASNSSSTHAKGKGKAFEDILPQPLLPSASSSSSSMVYDVFLNHRGCDVKEGLATDIYHALNRMGPRVFLDKEVLEYGNSIPREIEDAMLSASLCIAIFSPRYAESSWCLDELSFMVKNSTKIIPIFYNVEPSDLRLVTQGKGVYASTFSQHEKKRRYTAQKLEEWKSALHNVSFFHGHERKRKEDEDSLLKSIVNSVLKEIGPLEVARYPVALDEIVEDFKKCAFKSSHREQQVNIVGIVGMGGSGKTTLAKELYNRECPNIAMHSFIFEVRDAAGKNTLHNLQEKLVRDLSGSFNSRIENITKGKEILRTRLRSLRVLIVLDDVDDVDQIDALLPQNSIFAAGSLIIVTTRELNVLQSPNISCIYRMKDLNPFQAKQLFCWHAFMRSDPLQEFEDLVEEVMNACKGLPLSLMVLGAQLYKKPKDYWVSQLDKISRILPEDITKRLKISFDALDREEKDMFLDTACFFLGEAKRLAIEVWNGSGWSGLHGWERLLSKCLVEFDRQNRIRMHDHLRDMGRQIAMERPPYRLIPSPNLDIWRQAQERIPIRGITEASTDRQRYIVKPSSDYRPLFKEYIELKPTISGIQLLVAVNNEFSKEYATLSKELRWLRLFKFQHSCLPSWLSLENLRVLELYNAPNLEELWQDNMQQPPFQLRELIIDLGLENRSFQRFPRSIECLRHLKRLSCIGGKYLKNLPKGFCNLQLLEHLELQYLEDLSSLPSCFGDLTNLRHLNLKWCSKLKMLPDSFKQLKHLQYLNLQGCSNLTFTEHNADILENIIKLEYLSFNGCKGLQVLPHHITKQTFLRELDLVGTSFSELPSSIGQLERLEVLRIGSAKLESLPDSLGNLSILKVLRIGSLELDSLPDSLGNLSSLTHLRVESCKKVRTLPYSLGNLSSLTHLRIESCKNVRCLPVSLGNLSRLQVLRICSMELESLPDSLGNLSSLAHLRIESCWKVRSLPDSLGYLSRLKVLRIGLAELESLPDSLGNLSSLTDLRIESCKKMRSLPDSLGKLSRLEVLRIGSTELESLPDSLGNLCSLTCLRIESCKKVMSLPESLGRLALLKSLYICSTGVESLPKALGHLINLQTLSITDSPIRELFFEFEESSSLPRLKTIFLGYTSMLTMPIPEHFCPGLETLDLSHDDILEEIRTLPRTVKIINLVDCKRLKDITGIGSLRNLQRLTIRGCPKLAELPSFAEFASMKEIKIRECQISGKMEGLEQLTSLEILEVHTLWEVPGIKSLEHAQRLRRLRLTADKIGALEPCIKTLQTWPGEVVICCRALGGVESVVKAFTSSNVMVVEASADPNDGAEEADRNDEADVYDEDDEDQDGCRSKYKKMYWSVQSYKSGKWRLGYPKTCLSREATIVCFVINCLSQDDASARVWATQHIAKKEENICNIKLREGKWVWIHVSHASFRVESDLEIHLNERNRVDKRFLTTGEEINLNKRNRVDKGFLATGVEIHLNESNRVDKGILATGEERGVKDLFYQVVDALKM